jgi:hypothetical protein
MLPGLPPRDKSFKGWLFPLVIPIAAFVIILCLVASATGVFGDGDVTVDGRTCTGFDAVIRIVLAAPVFFLCFLLITSTGCWLSSRRKENRK